MREYSLAAFGIEHFRLRETATPTPGAGQVRVDVKALSLNYRDLLVVKGAYNPKLKLPATPLSDGAGVVSAVGPGVTRVAVGDRVMSHFVAGWIDGPFRAEYPKTSLGTPGPGLAAEQAILPAEAVVPIPENYSFEQAATLPIAALTAWSALVTEGGLDAHSQQGLDPCGQIGRREQSGAMHHGDGERVSEREPRQPGAVTAGEARPPVVLLLGTGGVSIFALQIAEAFGATVVITSSSDEKLARAKKLGADHGVNYRANPDWDKTVVEITGGRGADITVETGGAGTLDASMRATRGGGLVAVLGALTGVKAEVTTALILMKRLHLAGIYVDSRAAFESMSRFLAQRPITPVIDARFSFERLPDALRHLEAGRHFGKIVVS